MVYKVGRIISVEDEVVLVIAQNLWFKFAAILVNMRLVSLNGCAFMSKLFIAGINREHVIEVQNFWCDFAEKFDSFSTSVHFFIAWFIAAMYRIHCRMVAYTFNPPRETLLIFRCFAADRHPENTANPILVHYIKVANIHPPRHIPAPFGKLSCVCFTHFRPRPVTDNRFPDFPLCFVWDRGNARCGSR